MEQETTGHQPIREAEALILCQGCNEPIVGDEEESITFDVDYPRPMTVVVCSEGCKDEILETIQCNREEDYQERMENGDCIDFADPGGRSALRAATNDNPRNLPCPKCGRENTLTPLDRQHGYQCDRCADIAEGRIIE